MTKSILQIFGLGWVEITQHGEAITEDGLDEIVTELNETLDGGLALTKEFVEIEGDEVIVLEIFFQGEVGDGEVMSESTLEPTPNLVASIQDVLLENQIYSEEADEDLVASLENSF